MPRGTKRIILLLMVTWLALGSALAQRPRGGARYGRGRRPNRNVERLAVGDVAPAFTLKSRDGKRKVSLADFKGKKPVALVFGSYT